jgi:hypothetical protein
VAQELGVAFWRGRAWSAGAQNRLFRLDTLDGPPLLTMPQNYPGRELRELVTFVVSVRSENTSSSQCLGSGRLRHRNTFLLFSALRHFQTQTHAFRHRIAQRRIQIRRR